MIAELSICGCARRIGVRCSQSISDVFLHDWPLSVEGEDFEGSAESVEENGEEQERPPLEEAIRVELWKHVSSRNAEWRPSPGSRRL